MMAQQGGSLLKFDKYDGLPVFLTLLPQARAKTKTALGCASRESHPSEDLSELPPLLVSVAGQEYQRRCCHRKTGRPWPVFWTVGPARYLIATLMQLPAQVGLGANLQCCCPFSVFTRHTNGCVSVSGYAAIKLRKKTSPLTTYPNSNEL